jgi:hypothetical protein
MSYAKHPQIFTKPREADLKPREPFQYANPAPPPFPPSKVTQLVFALGIGVMGDEAFIVCAHKSLSERGVMRALDLEDIRATEIFPCGVHPTRRHWIIERLS